MNMKILLMILLTIWNLYGNYLPLFENTVIKNSKEAFLSAKALQERLKKTKNNPDFNNYQQRFKVLLQAWKRTQVLYVAGDLDDEAIDLPFLIDIYHNTKTDIGKSLFKIMQGQGNIKSKLYKNSLKSINALEFVLFPNKTDQIDANRRWEMAHVITDTLVDRFKIIYDIHSSDRLKKSLKDTQWINTVIIDNLIQSSYKLKEWRVGDAAGLSQQYKGDPNNKRLEYYISGLSTLSIQEILKTHYEIMFGEFRNFGDISIQQGAKKEVGEIKSLIKKGLKALSKIKGEDLTTYEAKQLFNILNKLHDAYYISLIKKLDLPSNIIDADGD